MQQTAGEYGMNEIKTIKFEARPVGMSEKTAERLSGEGSSDEKRWLRYPDAVRILNRYAVSVIKEASQQFIENATSFNHQNTDEASLRREARNYMRQAAEGACLLKNRARLFGKSSPIARTLDGSVMEDILLYKGYSSHFDSVLNRIVRKMTGTDNDSLPACLAKVCMDTGKVKNLEVFINRNFSLPVSENKSKTLENPDMDAQIAACLAKPLCSDDWKMLYLKEAYADVYGLYNPSNISASGSICIRDTTAEEKVKEELEAWKEILSGSLSHETVLKFINWASRFDEDIVLSPWFSEYRYIAQDCESDWKKETVNLKCPMYRVTFDRPSLLRSLDWDLFKQGKSCSCLLEKNGRYYLLLLNPRLQHKLNQDANGEKYRVLTYKQIRHPEKTFPRLFVQNKYQPTDEILRIVKQKTYTSKREDRELWIEHCIRCLMENKEYAMFHMEFKKAYAYENMRAFYKDVERQGIYMGYDFFLQDTYLAEMVKTGRACLFELYCMDFSSHHHGKMGKNAATLRCAMSDDNMQLLRTGSPGSIRILGGTCRLYARPKQADPVIYKAGTAFKCRNGKIRTLPYAVTKKNRYTKKRYLFTMAVEIL